MAVTKKEFTDAAGRTAWLGSDGKVYTEGGNRSTGYTKDAWNARQVGKYGRSGGVNLSDETDRILAEDTAKYLIELEEKREALPIKVYLTTEEADTFLQKAIDQITPYYDKKRAEIEAGIQEGKIQNAEDILMNVRETEEQVGTLLKKYDLSQAETEEDFINTLADITATRDEDIAMKRADWKTRVDTAKQGQVSAGILTSGVGKSKIQELRDRQGLEEAALQRRAGTATTTAETAKKYDLQTISLARESAEQERVRKIGAPAETAATVAGARGTLGLAEGTGLPSEAEVARLRAERNITLARPEALTNLGEEQKKATESRKLTLQAEEESIRQREYDAQRKNINAEIAKNRSKLSGYGG